MNDVTVFLIRHGETPQHAENRYVGGTTDAPLNEDGRRQAQRLMPWAQRAELDGVVSSPLQRSRDTAAPAATAAGLTVRIEPRLIEVDFGRAELLTGGEMRERFPEERAAFEADAFRNPLPGEEPPSEATRRIRAVVDELGEGRDGRRVLVVSHGTLIRLLICELFGIDPGTYRLTFPTVRNTSGAVLRKSPERGWGLLAWNPPLTPELGL